MLRVLVVDDDVGLRLSVRSALSSSKSFVVEEAFDGIDAIEKFQVGNYNIVILDVDMPRLNGIETLKRIKAIDPSVIVLVLTAYAKIELAVEAVKEGAFDFLSKPIKAEDLVQLVEKAIGAHNLISSVAASAPVLMEAGRKIIGNTAQMQKVFNIINRLSKVDTPVLIRGASGTGKELVARAIHFNSSRKEARFVAINCSAIPENLFESELFGHEKGAFTGADQRKIGKFQYAEGGTLFLDELGDMPIHMQVKLLRVLQEKVFTPIGANREIESNVRIIAATNRPLEGMIQSGGFREDLYYRLNVMPIFLPALSERKNDIDHLVHMFIKKFNKLHGKRIAGVAPDALSILKKHDWPGNIRELENVIEHAFIMEETSLIRLTSFPENFLLSLGVEVKNVFDAAQVSSVEEEKTLSNADVDAALETDADETNLLDLDLPPSSLASSADSLDFNRQKEAFEREFIIRALKAFKGRINQTALHANIPKKTLLRKIEKYGINAKDYSS